MACFSTLFFSSDGLAQAVTPEKTETIAQARSTVLLEGRVSAAHLTGEAREYVYDASWEGEKGSELIWQIKNVYMVGLGLTVQPFKRLAFNADGWFNVNDGTGEMDDYDWFIRHEDWTHWSHSAQVELDKGRILDVNAQITLAEPGGFTLAAIVGYRYDNWKWTDYGDGVFIYSVNGFRDTVGYLPGDEPGISYEQTYQTPYLGIGISGHFNRLTLQARLTGSTLVKNEAVDHHYHRDMVFYDSFENGDMIALDISGACQLTDHWGIRLGYAYQRYCETTGDTRVVYGDGTTERYLNEAGAELEYHNVSVSFLYSF
ncbi:outer membrane protease [Desulfosarcina alkanivorans]|uniref:Outer membrane protease n=2 Tax=Desulfosarcina alkanivorans TaxID=571177 RepID=A0A5K7YD51_9BACT|nr:outer membrane protease [Desulfosarcina alkanivorans]